MTIRAIKPLALSAALAVVAGTACAGDPPRDAGTDQSVRDALSAAGYTDIEDVERDDGLWEAEARRDGRRVDVVFDPNTGRIYPEDGQTSLTEADVRASLESAGYQRIRDISFDDGLWEADAELDGVDYDLYLDPESAEVAARKRD